MVAPMVLGAALEVGKTLIDRFFPNEEEKRKAEAELLRLAMDGELKQVIGQLEVNAREAQHPSVWVSGWRPFIGWCCGIGFLWATIGYYVTSWLSTIRGWPAPPAVDSELLMYTMFGMLGIGGLRTIEKVKGAAK